MGEGYHVLSLKRKQIFSDELCHFGQQITLHLKGRFKTTSRAKFETASRYLLSVTDTKYSADT